MESYPIRTDLALESQERLKKDKGGSLTVEYLKNVSQVA